MSRLSNVLELSIATSITPEASSRRRTEIQSLPNKAKRFGALAVHDFAIRFPRSAARLAGLPATEFIGTGADSSVFRKGDNVIKIHRRSIEMSEPERRRLAQMMDHSHKVMATHMTGFVIDQMVDIQPSPLCSSQRAVQIFQRYHDWSGIGTFVPDKPEINLQGLERVCRAIPGIDDSLRDFVRSSRTMFEKTGFLPDTNGTDNLVLTQGDSPELILIDGQPIGGDHPGVQAKIISQLQLAEMALQRIT